MPDPKAAWAFLANSDLVSSAREVDAAIERMAKLIEARYRDRYPLVLVVMGGAVVFAGRLLPKLRMPLDFDYIHVSRYRNAMQGGPVRWHVEPGESVRGRAVLVLDDILDGGQTLAAVRERLLALGVESVACAVLVDKDLKKEKPIKADFVGLTIPDRFVFGCGMDARGLWRNLPEIRATKAS